MNETGVAGPAASLVGLDRDDLAQALAEVGEPAASRRLRARQLFHWIYYRGARDLADMTSVPGALRQRLAARFSLFRGEAVRTETSADGTAKWLVRFDPGALVETVHIPAEERGALCVSSQVGCTLTCRFCHTGTQRLVRNLTAGEIVGQVLLARDALGEWPSPSGARRISSLVMMGMGEPLYNFEAVAKALRLAMDDAGIAISRRRITLSTAGVAREIERCGAELGVNLAVSLHAVEDDLRDELVPLNRKYPLAELMAAVRAYPAGRNSRRITFEYVMLKGINDSAVEARALTRLIRGIPAKVNLIPFNPWPGAPYECSTEEAIRRFATIVNDAGYAAPVRTPRGRDILAACGQLRSDSVKPPKRRRSLADATAP